MTQNVSKILNQFFFYCLIIHYSYQKVTGKQQHSDFSKDPTVLCSPLFRYERTIHLFNVHSCKQSSAKKSAGVEGTYIRSISFTVSCVQAELDLGSSVEWSYFENFIYPRAEWTESILRSCFQTYTDFSVQKLLKYWVFFIFIFFQLKCVPFSLIIALSNYSYVSHLRLHILARLWK